MGVQAESQQAATTKAATKDQANFQMPPWNKLWHAAAACCLVGNLLKRCTHKAKHTLTGSEQSSVLPTTTQKWRVATRTRAPFPRTRTQLIHVIQRTKRGAVRVNTQRRTARGSTGNT